MAEGSAKGGGITFMGMLGILFIALKLTNCVDWPWWVVLAPIWGPVALLLVVFLVLAAAMAVQRRW